MIAIKGTAWGFYNQQKNSFCGASNDELLRMYGT